MSNIHFGMDDWGSWLPVAERRDDNSPAIYGWVMRQPNEKVPRGTAENVVAVRKHLSSLAGLWKIAGMSPSHKWLGYFQGQRRDAGNGNRDGI